MKTCMLIAGTRPNFVKVAPLYKALAAEKIKTILVHTGQHFDVNMSDVFFKDLDLAEPDEHLGVKSGNRIDQTRFIINSLEVVIKKHNPDVLVVVGDVTSTIAATIAATMANKPVVHVEAGLRSGNLAMPEEVNRVFVDHYAQKLFASEQGGYENLLAEGIAASDVYLVGNVMIDSYFSLKPKIDASNVVKKLGLDVKRYIVATIHRPQNVDDLTVLKNNCDLLVEASKYYSVVFPVHPRTKMRIDSLGFVFPDSVLCVEPQSYCDMIALMKDAACVMTDSGGIQEETTVLGVPCITMRNETERPSTVLIGTNEVVGTDREVIMESIQKVVDGKWKKGAIPELWDGHAAERVVAILKDLY